MELAELIRGAQEAMDRGDFLLAANACAHALESYPACLAAHRLRGEALLERGELDAAVEHFERVLTYDPLHVVAHLGLGVAAEERHDTEHAYVHYLHAWEINPALDQVREQLVKLRIALGGPERLHPTRVGLAHIHARTGQFGRAAAEWRAILAADPRNAQAKTALIEVEWRRTDDAAALALCQEVLRAAPDNVRAIAIQAEIEQRQRGHASAELVAHYRAIDPLGEIAALLAELRPDVDLGFLATESSPVPDFDFQAAPVPESEFAAGQPEPALSALGANHVPAPDLWDSLVRDLQGDGDPSTGEDLELEPFTWPEDGDLAKLEHIEPFSVDDLVGLNEPLTIEQPLADNTAWDADEESFGTNGVDGSGAESLVTAGSISEPSAASLIPASEPTAAPPAPPPASSDPFVTADGRVDLTAGWDELDRALQEATPSETAIAGYEDLLAEIDAGGVAPFVAEEPKPADTAWEPFTAEDFAGVPLATSGASLAGGVGNEAVIPFSPAEPDDVLLAATLAVEAEPARAPEAVTTPEDWGILDQELLAAIPGQESTGYTEFLRHIDHETLPPLPEEQETVDPLALPDTAGEPVDFDALLAVTSRDGTAPLSPIDAETVPAVDAAAEGMFAETREEPSGTLSAEPLADELAGIEPFSLDDIVKHEQAFAGVTSAHAANDGASLFSDLSLTSPDPAVGQFPIEEAVAFPEALAPLLASGASADASTDVPSGGRSWGDDNNALRDANTWPEVVSETSELMDRRENASGLFARLRAAKRQLIDAGDCVVDRSLRSGRVVAPVVNGADMKPGPSVQRRDDPPVVDRIARPIAELGLDLMEMRLRLIESREAAQEVATALETAIAHGYGEPLALRVLGEAYLRLGKTEQAAAQFRQAMLGRRRTRPVEVGVRS